MLPSHHAASAAMAGAVLRWRGWSWSAVAVFSAGAVLLDVDHYLVYVWQTGDLSLERAYWHHRRQLPEARRFAFRWHLPFWGGQGRPFHAVPALAALGVAARSWPALRPLAFGALLHWALDLVWGSYWAAQRDGPED